MQIDDIEIKELRDFIELLFRKVNQIFEQIDEMNERLLVLETGDLEE